MLLAGVVRSSSASATSSGSNPENLASSGESLASGSSKSPTVSPHAVAKSLLCLWSQLKFFFVFPSCIQEMLLLCCLAYSVLPLWVMAADAYLPSSFHVSTVLPFSFEISAHAASLFHSLHKYILA